MMKITLLVTLFLLSFTGCDLFKSEAEIKREMQINQEQLMRVQELEKLKLETQKSKFNAKLETEKSLAIIEKERELEVQKSLAMIEKDKVLEQKRLEVALKTKELEMQKAQIEAEYAHQQMLHEQEFTHKLQQYGFALLALVVIVFAFFLFYYFKKRREDEIQAYNDNLEKYFRQKEEAARLKIAEKVLDTIATGKFNKEQENRLIAVFSGDKSEFSAQESDNSVEVLELLESSNEKRL